LVSEYQSYKDNKQSQTLKGLKRKAEEANVPTSAKKMRIQSKITITAPARVVTQDAVDQLVTEYIVKGMCPLSTVEKESFINLIEGLAPGKKVLSRKTLSVKIYDTHKSMTERLKAQLDSVEYVCTTADIWSTNNKSYLGMTVHWIDEDLTRKSVALGCRRFIGSHTYDKIGELISELHGQFDLDIRKVLCTVTDNASNFRKAFSEYAVEEDDDDDDAVNEEIQPVCVDIESILNGDYEGDSVLIQLPRHMRCVCHSLNLLATTDADKAVSSPQYSRICHATFGKCQAIWNAVSRSTKASDAVADICAGRSLTVPCPTRWSSKYVSVSKLLQLSDKLHEISEALSLPKLSRMETEFMKEYCTVMEPVATTLDQLQGDSNCFLGLLLPKLIQLRLKLKRLTENNNLQYCTPLAHELLSGINKRFRSFLDLDVSDVAVKQAILAAVAHPAYKLKWVTPEKRDAVTQLFLDAVVRLTKLQVTSICH